MRGFSGWAKIQLSESLNSELALNAELAQLLLQALSVQTNFRGRPADVAIVLLESFLDVTDLKLPFGFFKG